VHTCATIQSCWDGGRLDFYDDRFIILGYFQLPH
jgi:hypothetical protein